MGDGSGTYVVLIDLEVDCRLGPFFSPRGVIMLATMMTMVPVKLRAEMMEMRALEFVEEAESLRRRMGQREEWMLRVITLQVSAEFTLLIA
jgi:hypothetical protein